jgi:hypothetical protein
MLRLFEVYRTKQKTQGAFFSSWDYRFANSCTSVVTALAATCVTRDRTQVGTLRSSSTAHSTTTHDHGLLAQKTRAVLVRDSACDAGALFFATAQRPMPRLVQVLARSA